MKQLGLLILMIFFICSSFGQKRLDSLIVNNQMDNDYLLDSNKIDISKTYLDPDNIDDIYIIKKGDSNIYGQTSGIICLNSKNKNHIWIRLSDLEPKTKDSLNLTNKTPSIFVIDKKYIKDTANVRIENTTITSVEVLRDDKAGVRHDPEKITILITTKLFRDK